MKKYLLLISIALISFYCQSQKNTPNNKALNSRSDTIDVLDYQINLDMTDIGNQLIKGNCVVTFTPKINGVTFIDLDLQELLIDSITSSGSILTFSYNDTLINITLPATLNTTDTSSVTVYYNGSPQKDPSTWGGFYFQSGYAFNLGVGFQDSPHNYGRIWFPCFDNFVEKSTYEFNIITGQGKKAHCNGALMNETIITGDTIVRKWVMNEEIPTYLACVAVADYETVYMTFNGINGPIPVELVGVEADTANMKNSFVNLNNALDAYEDGYGPYLWNKIGFSLVPFNAGAMEHATNIAYPRSAATGSLANETLMAHEFSHHWWGDLVTCETAEDMWINEGMAVYSEHLFLEKVYGYATSLAEIKDNHKSVLQFAHIDEGGFRAISGIPHEYTYGDHVYKKGASVAHNMRAYLGDSLFFVGLKSITNTYKFKNINSSQFRDELTSSTGINMTNFFNDWVFSPGFSHFDIDSVNITPNGPDFDITIDVQQKLRGTSTFHTGTPLEITFYDNNWNMHKDTIIASGQYSTSNVTIPFIPTVYILNESNRLNQARTDNQIIANSTFINNNLNLALVSNLSITSIVDSALLQFEHHWVAPDTIKNNVNNYRISTSRYWSIDGILPSTLNSSFKLFFDGRASQGFLDFDLVPVNGDSLILVYRESPISDWQEYPYYTKTTISQSLAYGWVTIDSLLLGEYTFANSASAIGIEEEQKTTND
ncbi:MAG: M1 family metallopeptidase, partial [Flavobacteriales bacterium]|nr:M1 family metallopeptidase [Flavobacteriales bacterium]